MPGALELSATRTSSHDQRLGCGGFAAPTSVDSAGWALLEKCKSPTLAKSRKSGAPEVQLQSPGHRPAIAILEKPCRLQGEELRFLRKHIDANQEEFARLLHVDKTTLSKWENNEDPIGLQSDLLARAVVISRDKRLEKRAADRIRAFERIADKQKCVRVEVDPEKLEYEYA